MVDRAIASDGRFSVALSGGSTPRGAYSLLATPEVVPRVDWDQVHIFWGDERCLPPDNSDSNYYMARDTLLDHVPIPEENVHRIQCELGPVLAAEEYDRVLREFFNLSPHDRNTYPRFDLVLLGMGADGHTASLFPGTTAIYERERLVVADYVQRLNGWRVSLTPPVINAAAQVMFLVSGLRKSEMLRQVLTGPHRPDIMPAQVVKPVQGCLSWLIDAQAADQDLRRMSGWSTT